jgi:CheY-like chemotaxis protein
MTRPAQLFNLTLLIQFHCQIFKKNVRHVPPFRHSIRLVEKPNKLVWAGGTQLLEPCRILFAECDNNISRPLALLLRRKGFHFTIVETGAAALALARSEHFDAALLDVDLPDIDGFKLCAQFRANPATGHLPVVIWSAWGDLETEALEAGAVGCLEKPADYARLAKRLRHFASLRRSAACQWN